MSIGVEYTLIRSRRKTLAIHITGGAAVEVRAPLKMPRADIDRFVAAKEKWINAHLRKLTDSLAEKSSFYLDYGDKILLCGKEYPIAAEDGGRAGFDGERFFLPPGLPPESIKDAVIRVYKLLAKRILNAKAAEYSAIMGAAPLAIRINSARTRWGSCSGKNSLNFSWKLIMAGEDVIDYVVVHELAHIKEHNHSPRFWAAVAGVVPDYAAKKRALKALQEKLSREDWD
ncbi:MAG: M48 family metallopeptidase [Defluviitaleaceae bacterium]|nr:M48 family metallopeptidase [Defluviitaleaceae bacterium]